MIYDAYFKGSLDIRETRFFEAHSMRTPVGDPLKADAIDTVFRPHRSKSEPLYVGTVRSSIGYRIGASGLLPLELKTRASKRE